MKYFLIRLILAASFLSLTAHATTYVPPALINPTGSTTGQAIVSTGPNSSAGWASLTVTALASQAANTVVANATGSPASPTAVAMPSCSTSSSALDWTSGTGFTCNTTINASTLGGTAAASYALLASPTFTGTPAAPTAAAGTNTAQVATTANVISNFATPPTAGYGSTTPEPVAATTISATGLVSPSSTVGIKGTTTNDSAQAGSIGEVIAPTNLTAVSLSSGVAANCSSVLLTAGDWELSGVIAFNPTGTTTISQTQSGISTTSATMGAGGTYQGIPGTVPVTYEPFTASPVVQIKIASTTTVYLVGLATFGTSTLTCSGFFSHIRRIR
jgi:hypothetical protein